MARGGYRKPGNPAPVSGPGALSRRTDGGAGSKQAMKEIRTGKYGESKAIMEQQQGAPMAGNPAPTPAVAAPTVTGLMQPTERPQEPVTAGMPFGPGTSTLPITPNTSNVSVVQKYLPTLETLASSKDANDTFRAFVRAVKANVEMGKVQ